MDSCLENLDLSLHTPADSDRRVWHFNVAFIGNSRAGKTKLLQRFVDSQFSDIYNQTVETSFVSKSVSIGKHYVVFQCWDTPGSARSSGCLDPRLTQLHAIFVIFDASRNAVTDLEHWHHLATASTEKGETKPLIVLVANKTDLGCHDGTMTRARKLARACKGLIFSLSVLSDEENLEVDAMMLQVGKALTEKHNREIAVTSAGATVTVSEASPSQIGVSVTPDSTTATLQGLGDRNESAVVTDTVSHSASITYLSQPLSCSIVDEAASDALNQAEGDKAMMPNRNQEDDVYAKGDGPSDGKSGEVDGDASKSWLGRVLCCCTC